MPGIRKHKFKKIWYVVGVLTLMNAAIWSNVLRTEARNVLAVDFLDVGQGDAIYLRTVQGNDILVDAGPGDAILSELGRVMPVSDRTIELMILTHPHADHVAGMIEILKRYKVERIMLDEIKYDSETFQTFLDLARAEGSEIIHPALGQRIFLDNFTVMDILYPVKGSFTKNPPDINDSSIVSKVSFGKEQILLTGDAGRSIESFLLATRLPLDAEILKIGHHGSRHSSSEAFLKAVHPDYAVIQVGEGNRYGHPHPEIIQELSDLKIPTLRSDVNGTVKFLVYPDRLGLPNTQ